MSASDSGASVLPRDDKIDEIRHALCVGCGRPQDIQVRQDVAAPDLVDVGDVRIDDVDVVLVGNDVLQVGEDAAEDGHKVRDGVRGGGGEGRDGAEDHELDGLVVGEAEGEGGEVGVVGTRRGRCVEEAVHHRHVAVPAVDRGSDLVL